MLFISSKKLFSFSVYSNFCIFISPYFYPVGHCFRGWSKINLRVYDVTSCLNKNLITRFVWYIEKGKSIDRVLNKAHFYGKYHAENVHQRLIPAAFWFW